MEKEDTELIKPGDILNIKKPGEQKSVEAVVEYVDQTGEGKAKLTAAIDVYKRQVYFAPGIQFYGLEGRRPFERQHISDDRG